MKSKLFSFFVLLAITTVVTGSAWGQTALKGHFTINANGDKVVFSSGNLRLPTTAARGAGALLRTSGTILAMPQAILTSQGKSLGLVLPAPLTSLAGTPPPPISASTIAKMAIHTAPKTGPRWRQQALCSCPPQACVIFIVVN